MYPPSHQLETIPQTKHRHHIVKVNNLENSNKKHLSGQYISDKLNYQKKETLRLEEKLVDLWVLLTSAVQG